MSKTRNTLYLIVGFVVFLAFGWLSYVLALFVQSNPEWAIFDAHGRYLVTVSSTLSASGLVFTLVEFVHLVIDKESSRISNKLHHIQEKIGIVDCFSQKGNDDVRNEYRTAIRNATQRVWAFGLTNNEFLLDNQENLVANSQRREPPEIFICFADPDVNVNLISPAESSLTAPPTSSISLLNLIDLQRSPTGKPTDRSEKIREQVRDFKKTYPRNSGQINLRYVCSASFLSAMVIDDTIYFFPYIHLTVDPTRNPYLKLHLDSELGRVLFDYLNNLKNHPLLSRSAV